jgi:hypothetical protein
VGLDSRHSRMSLAKTGTVTGIYSPGRGSDEDESLDSVEQHIGLAVSIGNHSPPRRPSQVRVTHHLEAVTG